ncbi:PREDICTED: uncharacterized protein LOC106813139 [Priapulus caudatus]|uniref:Uncharacterized protein LOC106813139 n=1 Tax=Priapulus caudatus TaxID=37621 RepID=A0ABM1EKG3_PRICU|nr:PREDICTED: uncharacterized protein LOC106813139 [Priapulus caudatus]
MLTLGCDTVAVLPCRTRSDRGSENGMLGTAQMLLRADHSDKFSGKNAHVYGASTSNQVVERWWRDYREGSGEYFRDCFKMLKEKGHYDPCDNTDRRVFKTASL